MRRTADDLLEGARRRIGRLEPAAAWAAAADGALLIDIRCELDRQSGVVPGSLHVPRTVLEWRLDPASPWRETARRRPRPAARAALHRRLLLEPRRRDAARARVRPRLRVVGGFVAWRLVGLPVIPPGPPRALDELAGMRPPEPRAAEA